MDTLQRESFVPPQCDSETWETWSRYIAPLFKPTPGSDTDLRLPFSMTSIHLGTMIVGEFATPAQHLERSAGLAARQGVDHVLVKLFRHGCGHVETAGGNREIGPGRFVVCDLAQPIAISLIEAVSASIIFVPRRAVAQGAGAVEALHGEVLDYADDLAAELFFSYLHTLLTANDRLEPHHVPALSQAGSSLCGAFLRGRAPTERGATGNLGVAIRQFIGAELASSDLGADSIVARFRLSRASLYRLFEADGGVQNYIRNRRLTRAMNLMTQPDGAKRYRVSSVAFATGFSDISTFSRAFKRRFGVSPRDIESDPLHWRDSTDEDSVLLNWMRDLGA